MLCLTVLTLAAPAARAGSYAVSYSGGTYTDGSGNTQPDTVDGGGDYGAGPAASIQGTITVTCTWVPDDPNNPQSDPPPQNAILDETGYAYWEAEGGTTTAGGSCDDGLGDLEVPNTDSLPYLTSGSPQLDNDHYSVHAGGASFTYTRTPSVSSGGDNQDIMIYSAYVSPINLKVVLGGVQTQADGQVALTGQQVTATLIDPATGQPYSAQSYSWSAAGNAFETWDPAAPNASHATQLVPLSAADTTVQTLKFYDAVRNDTATASCTAPYLLPDGTTQPITVQSQPVTFLKPTATWFIQENYVRAQDTTDANGNPAIAFGLVGDLMQGSPNQAGMKWIDASITVPAPFSGGQGCFAQVITPDGTSYLGGNTGPTYGSSYTGIQCLDNGFPAYNYTWPAALYGQAGDSPNLTLPSGNDKGYPDASFTLNPVFNTWIMYSPGGVWVPLMTYTWQMTETIDWSTVSDNWYLAYGVPSAGDTPEDQASPTDSYPTWTKVLANT